MKMLFVCIVTALSLIIVPFSFAADIDSSAPPVNKPVPSWFSMTITDDESTVMFDEAKVLVKEQKLNEAILIFGKLAALSPSRAQTAHLEVAKCHITRGDRKRAIQWLVVYGQKYGGSAKSLFLLGQVHGMVLNYGKSAESYEASLKLDNSDPAVHFALALTYDRLSKHSKTIKHAQLAVQLDSSYKKKLHPLIKNGNLARDVGNIVDEVLRETEQSQLSDEQINEFAKRVGKILAAEKDGQKVNPQLDAFMGHIKKSSSPSRRRAY